MTTSTDGRVKPSSMRSAQGSSARRLRKILGVAGTYALLTILAIIFAFPFLFMLSTSLKTSEEVFAYPPKLMPTQARTAQLDGEELPVYSIALGNATYDMVPAETGVRAGVFVPSDDPTATPVTWPLDLVTPLSGADGAPLTATVDGEEMPLYDVTIAGQTSQMAKIRDTAVARFVDPSDPSRVSYAVLRTSTPVESPTAHPENYSEVLQRSGFDRNLTNTILVTLAVVFGQLFTSIIGGYAFARIPFPGRNALFLVYLGSMMIPFVVLIIPLYQLMVGIGWVNKIPALIFPWIFTAYGTFLMRQFFISVPKELEEAAFMDGANRWTILWRVYVPLSLPALATLATFAFLYAWNSFVWPYIIIATGNTDSQVLTVALQQFGGRAAEAPQLVFAGVAIAVSVPVIAFVLLQRYFVENVATSGIK
jgi:ABC-type glycerol-3-phosphate transport system permease component